MSASTKVSSASRRALERELSRLQARASVLLIVSGPTSLTMREDLSFESIPPSTEPGALAERGIYDLTLLLSSLYSIHDSKPCLPIALLARIRDLHTRRLVLPAELVFGIDRTEMLGLGFETHATGEPAATLYIYDEDRYNEKRDWNSPEDWANPENFDKYRW